MKSSGLYRRIASQIMRLPQEPWNFVLLGITLIYEIDTEFFASADSTGFLCLVTSRVTIYLYTYIIIGI